MLVRKKKKKNAGEEISLYVYLTAIKNIFQI